MAADARVNPVARALSVWAASRVAVVVLWLVGAYELTTRPVMFLGPLLDRWSHWDAQLYVKIAQWGYQGYPAHYPDRGVVAFFPGEPLALRLAHLVVRNWTAAGLLVSLVAGTAAVVALARLGTEESGPEVGWRSVVYLVLSPAAVFLFAGYSEALFLGFALPAWLFARRDRLAAAGVLAALAATVRITGVFLGVALLVQYVVDRRAAGRPLRDGRVLWLAGPLLATAGYFAYLYTITGDWLAWFHAETHSTWQRGLHAPWTAFVTTWHAAGDGNQVAEYALAFRVEIAAVIIGVVVTLALLRARRWGEAVYVGGQLVALASTTFYLSVSRATLVWFPLWLMLGRLAVRRRWVHTAYLAVAPALMALYVLGFTSGSWAG